MTQDDFIRAISAKAGTSLQDTEFVLKKLVEVVEECVTNRESFSIVNFCTLDFATVKEREVHSSLLGDNLFPATEKVYLRISKNLKQILKNTKK